DVGVLARGASPAAAHRGGVAGGHRGALAIEHDHQRAALGRRDDRVRNVVTTLDELLLLRDTQTKSPFFRSVELKIDYDVVRAQRGSLDLRRGSNDEGGFRTEVALYDPQTFELMGVATFWVSDRFFVQLSSDVRRELAIVAGATVALMMLVWAVLVLILIKLEKQRQERDFAVRELMDQ